MGWKFLGIEMNATGVEEIILTINFQE